MKIDRKILINVGATQGIIFDVEQINFPLPLSTQFKIALLSLYGARMTDIETFVFSYMYPTSVKNINKALDKWLTEVIWHGSTYR